MFVLETTRRGLGPLATLVVLLMLGLPLIARPASAQQSGNWSDPATWPTGVVPSSADAVVIESGQTVVLDGAAAAKTVLINAGATLRCGSGTLSLSAESVMVKGTLECGTAVAPFLGSFTLTLVGLVDNPSELGMGQKFLGVDPGGVLDLHGRPDVAWTHLDGTVAAGSTQIRLVDQVDWSPGSSLIIAASRDQRDENEVVTVASVSADQRTISLDDALAYPHYGKTTTYANGSDSWVLDERTEVGLLTRNIVIQGDMQSDSNGVGGHLMVMPQAQARVSGVELYRMGQRFTKRRYPFHWHLAGDVPGQYLRNSSIHNSYNRCAVIHGTNYAEVSDTVCYDFVGHGFFLEDGAEEYNVFDHDLAIGGRKPAPNQWLVDTDIMAEVAGNGPASFWMSNPNNTITNNAAAGSEGTGYWYSTLGQTTGDSVGTPLEVENPALRPWGAFENNRAHSMRQGFSSCRVGKGTQGTATTGVEIVELTTYHNGQNLWPCGSKHVFSRAITASSSNGFQAPTPMVFEDSVFISYSGNLPKNNSHLTHAQWSGIRVYDQGFHFNRVHFVNYDHSNMGIFANGRGAFQRTMNRVENLTFDNSKYRWRFPGTTFGHSDATDLVHDLDGSLTGTAGTAAVMPSRHLYDSSCAKPAGLEFFGWVCPYRYALWRGQNHTDSGPLTMARSDGGYLTSQSFTGGTNGLVRSAVPITADYDMIVRYEDGMKHGRINSLITDAFAGDQLIVEYLDTDGLVTVTSGGPEVASLAALRAATSPAWYRHDHSTFIKYFPTGQDWVATDSATLCFSSSCSAAPRAIDPPTVTITSPLDGAEAMGGATLVSAEIFDPVGIAWAGVYVGTDLVAERTSPPWNFSLTELPQGVHALKVVGQAADGETYTALQQLAVDPGLPSVTIDGADLPSQTVVVDASAQTVLIDGIVENFALGASSNVDHLRFEINGVDQGIVTSLPITAPVVHGVNRYELVLQRGDGGQIASATRDVYGIEAGVVADFEDGVDTRGVIVAPEGATSPLQFLWGSPDPILSRADGQNDKNFFDMYADSDNQIDEVMWELRFSPAQDWSGFGAIEVDQRGVPYDIAILDGNGTETLLGSGLVGRQTVDLPTDPALRSSVAALRTIVRDSDVPAGNSQSRVHLFNIKLMDPVAPSIVGDVNCDGEVTADDAQLILEHLTGMSGASDSCEGQGASSIAIDAADVNDDGQVSAVDALQISQSLQALN